jgi:hypothetical protein
VIHLPEGFTKIALRFKAVAFDVGIKYSFGGINYSNAISSAYLPSL